MVSQRRKYFTQIKRNLPSIAHGYVEWRRVAWILPWKGISERWLGWGGGGGHGGNQVWERRALRVSAPFPLL